MLPDWKLSMTPITGASAPAIMNVSFGGTAFSFEVQPGPEGYSEFADRVRAAFCLPDDSDLNITFTCDEPCQPGDSPLAMPASAAANDPPSGVAMGSPSSCDKTAECPSPKLSCSLDAPRFAHIIYNQPES